jgi:membrane-bound serine protease (ClpP class)
MFGLTGVACVALLAGGSFLAGLSQWWPAISILAGLILIAGEILFLQGTFISGALGVLAFTGGVIGLFVVSDPTPESGTKQAFLGIASLVTSVGTAARVAWLLGPSLQLMRPWQAAVLHATLGEISLDSNAKFAPPPVGTFARAVTDLRPVGKIDIDGVRFDARSEGAWITSGTNVRILRSEGNEIIVELIA